MKNKSFNPIRQALLGAALIAAPAIAFAGNGPYIGIEGGANWLNSEDFRDGGVTQFHADYKNGYIGGLTTGYSFANGFRPELELDYRRNGLTSARGTRPGGLLGLGGGPFSSSASGRVEAYTAMGNLWYDFKSPTGFFSVVHPYLGGGAGFARLGLRHVVVTGAPVFNVNTYKSAFAYQGGAGVSMDFTPRLTASVDWRWLQTSRVGIQSVSAVPVNARYRSQSAMLGVRYSFGAEPVQAAPPPPPPVEVVPAPPPPAPVCTPPAGFKVDENCKIIPQKIILRSVNFKFNKADLTDAAKSTLDDVAAALKQQPDLDIEIIGYTDSTGPAAYNKRLSQHRADSVRNYLIRDGIDGSTLHAQGYGEADPVATNKTRAGRTLNRRVAFTVTNAPEHVLVIKKEPTSASVKAATPK